MGRAKRKQQRRREASAAARVDPLPSLLEILATDSTFERLDDGAWEGRCLHCNARLRVAADGAAISRVTIEHIVPRSAGGTNALDNLALACAGCNHEKGRRHDARGLGDARAAEVITALLEKRRARWRDPAH